MATLAESPTLKAALDTYQAERRTAPPAVRSQLVATVARELDKLATRLEPDVLAARDVNGDVLAVSGRRGARSGPPNTATPSMARRPAHVPDAAVGVFRAVTVPVTLQEDELGSVQLAQALDDRYATELSTLSGARTLIVSDDRIVATTLPPRARGAHPAGAANACRRRLTTLNGEEYAVRPLLQEGSAAVYVLDSIDASARSARALVAADDGGHCARGVRAGRRSPACGSRGRSRARSTRSRVRSPR